MIDRKKEKKERKKERRNLKIAFLVHNVTVPEMQAMVKALNDFRAKGGQG